MDVALAAAGVARVEEHRQADAFGQQVPQLAEVVVDQELALPEVDRADRLVAVSPVRCASSRSSPSRSSIVVPWPEYCTTSTSPGLTVDDQVLDALDDVLPGGLAVRQDLDREAGVLELLLPGRASPRSRASWSLRGRVLVDPDAQCPPPGGRRCGPCREAM